MFSMNTPCQQASAALPLPSESQTSSEARRSFPRAIITPWPTPCQQLNVGTRGPCPPESQIVRAAFVGDALRPST